MKIAALSSRAVAGSIAADIQKHGYQGAFAEDVDDFDQGYQEFMLRDYDPQIGRFVNVDPFHQYSSPYLGMGDDPANGVDPTGGFFGSLGTEICEEVCAVASTTLSTALNLAGSLGLSTIGTMFSISFANTSISGNPQQGNPHYDIYLDRNGRVLKKVENGSTFYNHEFRLKPGKSAYGSDGSLDLDMSKYNMKVVYDQAKQVRGGRPSTSRQNSFKQQAKAAQGIAKKLSKPPQIDQAQKSQELTVVQRITEIHVEKSESDEVEEPEPNETIESITGIAAAIPIAGTATDVMVKSI